MNKKIIFLFVLLALNSCAAPGSAFLGPAITGVKTGSVYQTSLSYSSGKVMNMIGKNTILNLKELNKNGFTESTKFEMPIILATNKVYPIYTSEVEIVEPLP